MNNTDLAPMELPRPNMTARTAGPTEADNTTQHNKYPTCDTTLHHGTIVSRQSAQPTSY
jgi:hypothetical protein